jgi:hypothetical protein
MLEGHTACIFLDRVWLHGIVHPRRPIPEYTMLWKPQKKYFFTHTQAETWGKAPDYSMNLSSRHCKICIYYVIHIIFKNCTDGSRFFFGAYRQRAVSAVNTQWFIKQTQYPWNVFISVPHAYSCIFGAHMFTWGTFSSVKIKSTSQVIHNCTQNFLLVHQKQANCIAVLDWWHYIMHHIVIAQWHL